MKNYDYIGNNFCFSLNGKPINRGSNGEVYSIKYSANDGKNYGTLVCKKFTCQIKDCEKKERLERFKRESKFVYKNNSKLKNVIPVLDCGEKEETDDYWYIMPLAQKFEITSKKNLLTKIEEIKEIAIAIKSLHDLGEYAHRDIKPSNILIYKGKLHLSDFGLLWGRNEPRLTYDTEKVGPRFILPPELLSVKQSANIDYRKSDVYLFAKVLWMYLKMDEIGFQGEYSLSNKRIRLTKQEFREIGDKTILPVEKLMLACTKDDFNERIDIDQVVKYMDEEINILKSDSLYKKYIFEEEKINFLSKDYGLKRIYDKIEDVYELLVNIKNSSNVELSIVEDEVSESLGIPYNISIKERIIEMDFSNYTLHFKTDELVIYQNVDRIEITISESESNFEIFVINGFKNAGNYVLTPNQKIVIQKLVSNYFM